MKIKNSKLLIQKFQNKQRRQLIKLNKRKSAIKKISTTTLRTIIFLIIILFILPLVSKEINIAILGTQIGHKNNIEATKPATRTIKPVNVTNLKKQLKPIGFYNEIQTKLGKMDRITQVIQSYRNKYLYSRKPKAYLANPYTHTSIGITDLLTASNLANAAILVNYQGKNVIIYQQWTNQTGLTNLKKIDHKSKYPFVKPLIYYLKSNVVYKYEFNTEKTVNINDLNANLDPKKNDLTLITFNSKNKLTVITTDYVDKEPYNLANYGLKNSF